MNTLMWLAVLGWIARIILYTLLASAVCVVYALIVSTIRIRRERLDARIEKALR